MPSEREVSVMWSNMETNELSSQRAGFRSTSASTGLAAGVAIALASAVGMYYLDPRSGRRRRALLRDSTTRAVHQSRNLIDTAVADARNRAQGLYSMTTARLHTEPSDNQVLAERVRSKLGRVCSHPRAIRVACDNGLSRCAVTSWSTSYPRCSLPCTVYTGFARS
jgi:hypothetical protein